MFIQLRINEIDNTKYYLENIKHLYIIRCLYYAGQKYEIIT